MAEVDQGRYSSIPLQLFAIQHESRELAATPTVHIGLGTICQSHEVSEDMVLTKFDDYRAWIFEPNW